MPCNDMTIRIDQDRDVESEGIDAVGDLPNLAVAMCARILRISNERGNLAKRHAELGPGFPVWSLAIHQCPLY
jgi:hypothetical protein